MGQHCAVPRVSWGEHCLAVTELYVSDRELHCGSKYIQMHATIMLGAIVHSMQHRTPGGHSRPGTT
jgi:hypothetical protein